MAMTHEHDARPALEAELTAILADLVLPEDEIADDELGLLARPDGSPRPVWYAAAVAASLRYHDWAIADRELDRARAEAADQLPRQSPQQQAVAARKRRRIAKARREGRDYKTRAYLKDVSPEDRQARKQKQWRDSQQRHRQGPKPEDHPFFGKFH
ncbi:hypothetical protein [Mesorhizobium marinum]|uniref:hypothetical protein n=1 Tax=Mesorhizobium marinum TaxID=3228790 RepID=UPI003467C4A3